LYIYSTCKKHVPAYFLNELNSAYGNIDQKLTAYFLRALFSYMTDSGERYYRSLAFASDKTCSFKSTRKTMLKFQEVSPWTTFGHVACNVAIMEAFEGEPKLHIVDFSNTYCTRTMADFAGSPFHSH